MPRPSRPSPRWSMILRMLSPIEPRWTGMCGALAISAPSRSKMAQEKSSRSLMFTEVAVDCSATPISSAIAMNRLLNISSLTGSTSVPAAACRTGGCSRVRMSVPSVARSARQPGSTTVVEEDRGSGPGPGPIPPRSGKRVTFEAGPKRHGAWVERLSALPIDCRMSDPPTASAIRASTMIVSPSSA